MNWFRKRMISWLKREWYNDDTPEAVLVSASRHVESPVRFNFTVIPASGGKIVEFNTYDHQKDRSINTVHVIPDEADFTNELTKIVSIELLKN